MGRLDLVRLGSATLLHLSLADPQWYPARQSLRLDPSEYSYPLVFPLGSWGQEARAVTEYWLISVEGKSLKDEDVLQKLPVGTTATLYFRDLGAQISWVTVSFDSFPGPCLQPPWGHSPCFWVLPGLPD